MIGSFQGHISIYTREIYSRGTRNLHFVHLVSLINTETLGSVADCTRVSNGSQQHISMTPSELHLKAMQPHIFAIIMIITQLFYILFLLLFYGCHRQLIQKVDKILWHCTTLLLWS